MSYSRATIALLVIGALILLAVSCDIESSNEAPPAEITISDPEPIPTPVPIVEDPTAPPSIEPVVTGLTMPIEGACLPSTDNLMPNAPRVYRDGIHEGVDFYSFASCREILGGTSVLAVKTGRVIRADHDYEELTAETLAMLQERIANGEGNSPDVLDTFRGRQVWIDHGGGVVTRYAHLGAVADDIQVGIVVEPGTVVGFVGDSGTPESLTAPGAEDHLHFELRVGEGFMGAGLPPDDVRFLYQAAFASVEAP